MEDLLTLLKDYGIYLAIPVVVAGIIQGLKISFKSFFSSNLGMRLIHFFPIILGAAFGLLLPLGTVREQLMYGAMLGQLSTLIYKVLTQTIASNATLSSQRISKDPEPVVSDQDPQK